MVAVRGMRTRAYVTDSGQRLKTRVDDDFAQNSAMGWSALDGTELPIFKGFKPRHVTGVSAGTGRHSSVRCATVACDLWTGAATTWVGGTNIETTDTYTVIQKIAEKPSY